MVYDDRVGLSNPRHSEGDGRWVTRHTVVTGVCAQRAGCSAEGMVWES